jgi:RHS repeat-associated protein
MALTYCKAAPHKACLPKDLPRPELMLDGARRVVGVGNYDPFGQVNRQTVARGTARPYANNTNATLATCWQAVGGTAHPSTQVRMRALLGVVDTEANVGGPVDEVMLKDGDTGAVLAGGMGERLAGPMWTPWVEPSGGRLQVTFSSNGSNCCPDGQGGLDCGTASCSQAPNYPYAGVSVAACESQRFQVGAQPFWIPLRLPGQYDDAETDLFENWNRFYAPAIGRYLQPEPMMTNTLFVKRRARHGLPVPPYAYAANSPVRRADPNGLWDLGLTVAGAGAGAAAGAGTTTGTGAAVSVGGAVGSSWRGQMCEFPGAKAQSPKPSTHGPCPGFPLGHVNVRLGKNRAGSITCCPCCEGPQLEMRCGTH